MRESNRHYPDVSFVDRDTDTLASNLVKAYEQFTGRTLYPADPARLFILWIADIIIQERVIINESAKQNVPRYAGGDYLDSLAELFKDVERLPAAPAWTTLRFYLSAVRPTTTIILKGTRVTVDGEIIFETSGNLSIPPGAIYGDMTAVCTMAGNVGNDFLPGQISQIIDVFPYYDRVENITASEGGADREDDDAFYIRLTESMEAFSTAGPAGAYVYWAKTASAKISDVKAYSPEPGVVDVRVLCRGGELPDDEIIRLVEETLNQEKTRPLTDRVIVSAPDVVPYDIDIVYYIPKPRANSASVIINEVTAAIEKYKLWQSEQMGRDINPDELTALIIAAGAKRVVISAPEFTVIKDYAVAVLRNENIIYGGIESE